VALGSRGRRLVWGFTPACDARQQTFQQVLPTTISKLCSMQKRVNSKLLTENARLIGLALNVPAVDLFRTFSLAACERVVTPWMFPMSPKAL
jgi:hypothetical protein